MTKTATHDALRVRVEFGAHRDYLRYPDGRVVMSEHALKTVGLLMGWRPPGLAWWQRVLCWCFASIGPCTLIHPSGRWSVSFPPRFLIGDINT